MKVCIGTATTNLRAYVAADWPRDGQDGAAKHCVEARRIATAVDWPCKVHPLFRDKKPRLRVGVSTAIDWFFEHEAEGIIFEDDCAPPGSRTSSIITCSPATIRREIRARESCASSSTVPAFAGASRRRRSS